MRRPKLRDDRPWSHSQVDTYLACPKAYELKYIQGLTPKVKSCALAEGKAMHAALEARHQGKTKEEAGDLFQREVRRETVEMGIDWKMEDTSLPEMDGRAKVFLERYDDLRHVPFDETSIEKKVEGTIAGVPFVAYMDLIRRDAEGNPCITDYKVTRTAKDSGEVEQGMQLGIYSILTGIPAVEMVSFVKTKTPKVVAVAGRRSRRSLERVERVIHGVVQAVHRNIFPYASPTSWKCSRTYCDFWHLCPQGEKA